MTTPLTIFCDINRTITLVDTVQGKDEEISICELLAESCGYKEIVDIATPDKAERYRRYKQLPQRVALAPLESQIRTALREQEGPIFSSLLKLLQTLHDRQIPHTFVLRSFGTDTTEIINALEGKLPFVKFTVTGQFEKGVLYCDGKPSDPMAVLQQGTYQSWRDDYSYWKASGFKWTGGKPWPLAGTENSYFLDDKVGSKEIVVADPHTSYPNLITVDTVEALTNPDYFLHALHVN